MKIQGMDTVPGTDVFELPGASAMTDAGADELFERAPPYAMQRRLGLIAPDNLNIRRRALLVVLLGWVPLVVLTLLQGIMLGDMGNAASLLRDAGAHPFRRAYARPFACRLVDDPRQPADLAGAQPRLALAAPFVGAPAVADLAAAAAAGGGAPGAIP